MGNSNITKQLPDLFTLYAWHAKFDKDTKAVDLHVHVNFKKARMGGQIESDVTFELQLKKAEIIVIVPEEEGFSVDLESILRADPKTIEATTSESTKSTSSLGAGIQVSNAAISGSAGGEVNRKAERSQTLSATNTTYPIEFLDGVNGDGNNCWTLLPVGSQFLAGAPWETRNTPILSVLDERESSKRIADSETNMTAPIFIELHCLREDLVIDLEPKDNKVRNFLKTRGFAQQDKRMAAAEGVIRDELVHNGLSSSNLEEGKYARIILANVLAQERE